LEEPSSNSTQITFKYFLSKQNAIKNHLRVLLKLETLNTLGVTMWHKEREYGLESGVTWSEMQHEKKINLKFELIARYSNSFFFFFL
jgi:hypothetical protein